MPKNQSAPHDPGTDSRTPWLLVAGAGLVVAVALGLVGGLLGWFGQARAVAGRELGPEALLHKYEWFKDASAALDAKEASIKVYSRRFENLKKSYSEKPRGDWPREDREQANLWEQEVAGIRASYNSLAAEYNAAMAKVNWRFCNAGDLPRGADKPLPREYRPYTEE
jgi:hypothetical protein